MIPHAIPPLIAQAAPLSSGTPGLPPVAIGQTLTGTVQQVLPDGQALVQIKGQPLLLALPQPLAPGQRFSATVVQTAPTLVLQLLEKPAPPVGPLGGPPGSASVPQLQPPSGPLTAARLSAYLNAQQPFGHILTTLETFLHDAPWLQDIAPKLASQLRTTLAILQPQVSSPPSAAHVQAQVERSGFNYEAQVRQALLGTPFTPPASALQGPLLTLLQAVRTVVADGTAPHAAQATVLLPRLENIVAALSTPQPTAAPAPPSSPSPPSSHAGLHPYAPLNTLLSPSGVPTQSLSAPPGRAPLPSSPLSTRLPASAVLPQHLPAPGLKSLTTVATLLHSTPWLQELEPALLTQVEHVRQTIQEQPGVPQALPSSLKSPLLALLQTVQTIAAERLAPQASQATSLVPILAQALESLDVPVLQPPAPGLPTPPALSLATRQQPTLSFLNVPQYTARSPLQTPGEQPLAGLLTLLRQTPWLQDLAPDLVPQLARALAPPRPSASVAPATLPGQALQEPAPAEAPLLSASTAWLPLPATPLAPQAGPSSLKEPILALLQALRTVATETIAPHAPQAAALVPFLEQTLQNLDEPPPQHPASPVLPQSPSAAPLPLQAALTSLPLSAAPTRLPLPAPAAEPLTALLTLFRGTPWLQELAPTLFSQLDRALAATLPESASPEPLQTERPLDSEGEQPALPDNGAVTQKWQQDLKGQLLALVRTVQTVAADPASPYASQATDALLPLDKAIHAIEFQQLLNVASWQQQQPIVLPLLLPWNSPAQTSSLVIQRHPPEPQSGASGVPVYSFVLTLDVSALGPLRIETRLHGTQVSTTMKATQPEVVDFMLPQVPTLVSALHTLGFQAEVGCKVQDIPHPDALMVEQLAHLQRLLPARLVDVTL